MSEESANAWPLDQLIALAWSVPISDDSPYDLVEHMVGQRMHPAQFGTAMKLCREEVLRQFPWLARCEPPALVLDYPTNLALLCWVDMVEQRYGATHAVAPLPAGVWENSGVRYAVTDMVNHITVFFAAEHLPPELLRTMLGLVEDD